MAFSRRDSKPRRFLSGLNAELESGRDLASAPQSRSSRGSDSGLKVLGSKPCLHPLIAAHQEAKLVVGFWLNPKDRGHTHHVLVFTIELPSNRLRLIRLPFPARRFRLLPSAICRDTVRKRRDRAQCHRRARREQSIPAFALFLAPCASNHSGNPMTRGARGRPKPPGRIRW